MKELFRNYFIPHPGNDHAPCILRIEALLVMLAAVFTVEMLFLVQVFVVVRHTGALATILENVLVDQTNASRISSHLSALTVNPMLQRAAQLKADDMARNGYFAHTSPAGVTPWHWFAEAGYKYQRAGENLAINFSDSEDVIRAWLDSPSHRENIMNKYYSEIGIGISRGMYEGKETVFVVQLFGKPFPQSVAKSVPEKQTGGAVVVKNPPAPKPIVTASNPKAVPKVEGTENQIPENQIVVDNVPNHDEAPTLPSVPAIKYSSFIDRVAVQPRALANMFYVAVGTLILLALLLTIFVRLAVPHPHLLVNGMVFLLIIGSAVLLNYYLGVASAQVF